MSSKQETKRICLTLDLKNDSEAIRCYKEYHQKVWPEVIKCIHDSGINRMEIYVYGNRLFMIIEACSDFSFEKQAEISNSNPLVGEWESLMDRFQERLPGTDPGTKWQVMERIFLTDKAC